MAPITRRGFLTQSGAALSATTATAAGYARAAERFTNSAPGNELLAPEYRDPYRIPDEV